MIKHDKDLIPVGNYCGECPYWHRLGKRKFHRNPPNITFDECPVANECSQECWTNEFTSCCSHICYCEYMDYTDKYGDSLLWEAVKECGVNDYD